MNVHAKFVEYGRNARKWINECKMLLPEIDRRMIWRDNGYSCIYEYAAKIAGLSRGQVDDALRVLRKIEDKPSLKKVAREKGINSVRPVASIATIEDENEWAAKARKMSKHTLELYVREIRTGTEKLAQNIEMVLSQEVADQLKILKGQNEWETLMRELLEARKKLLELEKPEKTENANRHIPEKIKKWVVKTTNGRCSEPGCYKKYEVLHHEDMFSINRVHDPDRIKPLCKEHHELKHQFAENIQQYYVNQKMMTFLRAP